MQPPAVPAPKWCPLCETMVTHTKFHAHLRGHARHDGPKIMAPFVAPPKPALTCFYCGKRFAKYSAWDAHETGCEEASRIEHRFFTIQAAVYEF